MSPTVLIFTLQFGHGLSSGSLIFSYLCQVYWWSHQRYSSFLLIFLLLFLSLHVDSFIDIPSPALISPLSLYDLYFFSRALHILTIAILNSLSDNSNINTIPKFGLMVFCLLRLCFTYLTMATLYNFSVEIQTCYFRL